MLESALYKYLSQNLKFQEVISKSSEQSGRQDLHAQVRNSLDYPLSENQTYGFGHAQTFKITHVAKIYTPDLLSYTKNDTDKLRKALENISQYSFNAQYMEKILMIQNLPPDPFLRKSESMKNYLGFLQDISKIWYKKKHSLDLSEKEVHLAESLESSIKDSNKLLTYDLFNDSTLSITISLSEIIDRLTDSDEIQSCIVLNFHAFIHPCNWFLSPAALSLSFFNWQIIGMKKPKNDEPYYTKATLPRVAYLSLTGILSEMDINVLNRTTENIQIISIYDENTGGPTILRDVRLPKEQKKSSLKIDFQDASNKLLLLPLKCKSNKEEYKKEYTSNDILQLLEYAVIPSLTKFRPSYIVLNVSLIFDEKDTQTPFSIDAETLGYIVHLLGKLADCKVIVFPFKIPNMKDPETTNCFEQAKKHIEDKEEQKRLNYILDRYGVPYNEVYLRNSLVKISEVLSDQCDLTLFNRLKMRKMDKINPLIHDMCYQIGKFYKHHPYYKFLYSKTLNTLAKVVAQGLISIDDLSPGHEKEINSLVLHFPDPTGKKVSEVKKISLQVSDKPRGEIVLAKDSQYIVDYNEKGIPTVYIFNARRYEEDEQLRVKTSKEFGHYSVSFEMEEAQCVVADYKHISLEGNEEEDVMKDCGLCKGEEFVFQVYGTHVNKNEESNRIRYFDFVKQEMFSIVLTEEQKATILKRHSVTACAYKKDNTYYLYVFGGQIRSPTTYKGKEYGSLDIFDIVEVYQTDDPRSGKWEYTLLEKDNICENAVSFIPYNKSFGWYDKGSDKILIIGGKTFEDSIYNWTCPVFEFDVNKNRFTSFQLFLNHIKDNPNRKPIENNSYKAPFMTTAIASSSPNIYFDSKCKVYKFIIPLEYEDIICIFSYNQDTRKCDYRETQIQPSVIKIKGSLLEKTISNPDRVGKKPIVINPRVATLLNYSFPFLTHRKILLKLTEWRMKQDEEVIHSGPIQTEWERIIKDMTKNTTDPEDQKELEIKLFDWSSFREFEDIFMKKDNRLDKLREYLTTQICMSILKILEDILLFKEFTDSVADKISGKIEKKTEDSFKSISTGSNSNPSQSGKSFDKNQTTNFKKKTFEYMKTLIEALRRYRDTKTLDNDDFDTLIAEGSKLESELDIQLSLSKIDSASNPESFSSVISEFKDSLLQNVMEGSTELVKKLKRRTEYNLRTDTSNLNRIINELMNLVKRNIDFFQIDVDPNSIFGEEVPAKYEPIIKATKLLELCSVKGEQLVIKSDSLEWKHNFMELDPVREFLYHVNNELKALAEPGYDPISIKMLIDKGLSLSDMLEKGDPIKDLTGYLIESFKLLKDSQERTQIDQNIIKDLKRPLGSLSDQLVRLGDESTRTGYSALLDDATIGGLDKGRRGPEKHIDAANNSSFVANQSMSTLLGNTLLDKSSLGAKNVLDESSVVEEVPERKEEKALLQDILESVAATKPIETVEKTPQYTQTSETRSFKECLSASRTDRIMYNSSRSELVLAVGDEQEYKIKTRFRFAVVRRDHDLQKPVLETFSLDHSPSSVYVMGEAVVCFIDKKTKTRYPDLYDDYGSFIMFADIKFGVLPSPYGEDVKFLVFNKLFRVTQDDHIYQRSLVVTENFIVLLGGKSLKMKTNTIKNHNETLVYSVEKYSFGEVDSKFKVTDVDAMNNNGECIAIGYGKFIYVCKRESPSDLEIFTEDGISVEKVELPESHKNHIVNLSIVNIKDKDKILLTFSLRDKDRKFMLFDIKKKAFEEGEEIKIKRKNKGEDDEFGFLCSGFEEFDINSNISQGKNEVLLYNYRDIGEINICNVETT